MKNVSSVRKVYSTQALNATVPLKLEGRKKKKKKPTHQEVAVISRLQIALDKQQK